MTGRVNSRPTGTGHDDAADARPPNAHRVFTMWASLPDDPGPWMIAAEDEYAWEGNPERCEEAFKLARENAERSGFVVREVVLLIDYGKVADSFEPVEVAAVVSVMPEPPVAAPALYVATRFPPLVIRMWLEGETGGGAELDALLARARASVREALEAMGIEVVEEEEEASDA